MAIFSIFCAILLLLYIFEWKWKRKNFQKMTKKLPGHDGLSLLESISLAIKSSKKDYISIIDSFIRAEDPITKIWLGNFFIILTKNPKFINKIFNTPQTYDKPKVFYQVFFMDHALTPLSGDIHRRHRKILNKAFSMKILLEIPKIFNEKSKKVLNLMEKEIGCGEFELTGYIGTLALENFGKIHLNYECEYFESDILKAIESFMVTSIDSLPFTIFGLNKSILKHVNPHFGRIFSTFNTFLKNVINSNIGAENASEKVSSLLLDPQNGFSEEEIEEELILFTVASVATTTKTLSAILMMLGMHQNIQQKLYEEIMSIFSTENDSQLSLDIFNKFPYLDAVVKESMRLFPAIPIIGREANENVEIDGFLIPKGAIFVMSLYSMQRDEKYWGCDGHLFRPERFLDGLKNPLAFAPFADGKRICIGYKYAMISMKIFIINFLKTYKIGCSTRFEDIETEMTLTLNFVNGFKVSIERR